MSNLGTRISGQSGDELRCKRASAIACACGCPAHALTDIDIGSRRQMGPQVPNSLPEPVGESGRKLLEEANCKAICFCLSRDSVQFGSWRATEEAVSRTIRPNAAKRREQRPLTARPRHPSRIQYRQREICPARKSQFYHLACSRDYIRAYRESKRSFGHQNQGVAATAPGPAAAQYTVTTGSRQLGAA